MPMHWREVPTRVVARYQRGNRTALERPVRYAVICGVSFLIVGSMSNGLNIPKGGLMGGWAGSIVFSAVVPVGIDVGLRVRANLRR
jgi:hypothetical protein